MQHLWQHKKIFGAILALFFVLTTILVRGFGFLGSDIAELELLLGEMLDSGLGRLVGSVAILSFVASDVTGAPTEVASLYQTILFVLFSLAVIYTLRQTQAATTVRFKEAFYRSTYPLIPFLLVVFVIGLQLIPVAVGSWLYALVVGTGIAVHLVEIVAWGIIFFLLALLSLYMLTSSLFAVYIVTLPDMTPLQALRSARELVRFRRWTVLRKILFLPLMLLLIGIVILLPVVMYATVLAAYVILLYALGAIIITHAYMYQLYRELL